MATKYKISIVQITTEVPFKNKSYEVIGEDQNGKNKYGYVYFEDTEDESETIYEQTVDSLDIPAITRIVNGDK